MLGRGPGPHGAGDDSLAPSAVAVAVGLGDVVGSGSGVDDVVGVDDAVGVGDVEGSAGMGTAVEPGAGVGTALGCWLGFGLDSGSVSSAGITTELPELPPCPDVARARVEGDIGPVLATIEAAEREDVDSASLERDPRDGGSPVTSVVLGATAADPTMGNSASATGASTLAPGSAVVFGLTVPATRL
jgi:hypothetical protein